MAASFLLFLFEVVEIFGGKAAVLGLEVARELFWRVPRSFLEHSGEMLWVFKSQLFSHIVDGLAAKDEVLGASDDKVADVVFRAVAKKLPDDFTKIAW